MKLHEAWKNFLKSEIPLKHRPKQSQYNYAGQAKA